MTTLNWNEYLKLFDCFPEIGKWIRGKDNRDYKVVQVRLDRIVLEVR